MKWKNSYNYFVIAVLTLLIYGQSIGYKFNMDDELVTVGNKRVEKGFDGIKEILEGYYYEDDMGYKYGYRPVSQITFAIEYQLFGENPHFSHFVNVVLYILICSLIFYFLSTYIQFPSKWMPLLITLLFLVHPLHVEAVASIKNREELLAFLFPFIGLIISIKAIDSKRWYLFLLVALCNFLAIYSKQNALALMVSLPFLVVLLRQLNWWNLGLLILSYIPFVIISLYGRFSVDNLIIGLLILLALVLIYIIYVSMLSRGLLQKIKFKQVNKRIKLTQLLQPVITLLVIVFFTYKSTCNSGLFFFIVIMVCFFLIKSNRNNIYIRFGFLIPVYYFLVLNSEFTSGVIIALYLFETKFLDIPKGKIKNAWFYVLLLILFAINLYIVEREKSIFFIIIIPIFYIIIREYFTNYNKYVKVILVTFIILFIVNLLTDSITGIDLVQGLVGFFLMLLVLFEVFSSRYNKIVYCMGNKVIVIVSIITICLYLIGLPSVNYVNKIKTFQYIETIIYSNVFKQDDIVFDKNYKNKNSPIESRVIDFTENPYYYYKNNTIQNGQSVSSTLFYFKKILVPYPLSSYYGYNIINPILSPLNQFFILFGLIIVGILIGYFFRKEKIVLWSILLLAITLVSISNIFEVIPGIVADRLAFILVLPFSIILVSLIFKIFKNEKISLSLLGILILTFVLFSFFRVQQWETPYKLFSTDVKNFPQSAKLHSLLAHTIMKEETTKPGGINVENVKQAKTHLEQALKIYPGFFNSHYDLARVDEILKLDDEAIKHYNYVIEKDSTFYDVYLSLADLYLQQGNKVKAVTSLKKYIEYSGYNIDLYFNLSSLEYDLGNYNKVIDLNKEIIKNNPQVPEAYLNIAYAYGKLSNIEMLKKYLEIGEKLAPNHGDAKIIRQEFLTK